MRGKIVKGFAVVLSATALSTLGIFAADSMRGIDSNLASINGGSGVCPSGMVPIKNDASILCVDMYEATPSKECPHQDPKSMLDTEENLSSADCYAASVEEKDPWTFISLSAAQRMCARAGKRLPTSDEWYRAALGTEADLCVVKESGTLKTGGRECRSTAGTHDAIGNVWEWVDETISGNQFKSQTLPPEGYVDSADASGVAITSADSPSRQFGEDYFWSKDSGTFGMIRGGFYGSGDDAGLYTVNAAVDTTFVAQGVGFRCVEDKF